MLKKSHRLPATSIRPLLASGRKFSSPAFTCCYSPSSLNTYRLAVIVSKKVSPLATRRNQLKRQLTHLLVLHLSPNCAFDLVFILKPTPTITTVNLLPHLKSLFFRLCPTS